jgi:hypothetical protein
MLKLQMNKKTVYLFLALLLPGIIFVFLKYFGKNEFAIPVYYQNGIDSVSVICGGDYAKPYLLPDSILQSIGADKKHARVVVFEPTQTTRTELNRLTDIFRPEEFTMTEVIVRQGDSFGISEIRYRRWTSCIFFIREPYNAVLVDEENKIRGYYAVDSREEMDRLILEMQILLKKY